MYSKYTKNYLIETNYKHNDLFTFLMLREDNQQIQGVLNYILLFHTFFFCFKI